MNHELGELVQKWISRTLEGQAHWHLANTADIFDASSEGVCYVGTYHNSQLAIFKQKDVLSELVTVTYQLKHNGDEPFDHPLASELFNLAESAERNPNGVDNTP